MTAVQQLSPLVGLRRRSLTGPQVLAQSVAVTAPSAAMASTPTLVAAVAGPGTIYAYLAAIVVIALVAVCVRQFARRLAVSGSLYTFVAHGLGGTVASVAGAALVLGYALLAMATLVLSSWYLLVAATRIGLIGEPTPGLTAITLISVGLIAAWCLVRGIGVSSLVALGVEAIAIVAILAVLIMVGLRSDAPLTTAFSFAGFTRPHGPHGILLGTGLALASFIGFESSAALGGEARKPLASIPRALGLTVVAVSGLYLLAAVVQLRAFGPRLGTTDQPLLELAGSGGTTWWVLLLDLAVVCSGFACTTGSATALARLLFSMARERAPRSAIGRTAPASQAPHTAIAITMSSVIIVPVVLVLLGLPPQAVFAELLALSTLGYLLCYVGVCVALPIFLHRIGELSLGPALAGIVGATALIAVFVAFGYPRATAPGRPELGLLAMVVGAAALAHRLHLRRWPGLVDRIGLHHAPTLADLHRSQR